MPHDVRKTFRRFALALIGCALAHAAHAVGPPEKTELRLGFIKLTDMAPLAVAQEEGYFADEGLSVSLEAQPNWDQILEGVLYDVLDGAHMLAGQPLAARIGYGLESGDIVTPFSMDRNGNAITVSNAAWESMSNHISRRGDGLPEHPIGAEALRPLVDEMSEKGEIAKFSMVFPVSTHNYELRYWLAAGGIHPGFYSSDKSNPQGITGWIDADVRLYVTPPPQMPKRLTSATIVGYCVGEPWNQKAVFDGIGVPVITDNDIWKDNPEKVFGLSAKFVEENPNTTVRLVRALLRAAKWLDAAPGNRQAAVQLLARPAYVGASPEVIANSMTGTFEYEKGDKREAPDFNVFFRDFATYPYYSDAVWYLTQMRRWGQIDEAKSDDWYIDTAKAVYRPDIYAAAAKELIEEGVMSADEFPDFDAEDGFRPATDAFIDGIEFDGRAPSEYLRKFPIGQQD